MHKKMCYEHSFKGCSGVGYFLGFVGTVIYYISTATTFSMGFVGFLKALVWPGFLIYEIFKFLGI